jgi:hypothetical protein
MQWPRTVLLTALCLGLASAASVPNCQFGDYDLSALANQDIVATSGSVSYKFRACGVVSESVCAGQGGSLCKYSGSTTSGTSEPLSLMAPA